MTLVTNCSIMENMKKITRSVLVWFFVAVGLFLATTVFADIVDSLIIGGSDPTSSITIRSTSGVGVTGADIILQTGNNGGTEAMRILNNGRIGVGTANPAFLFDVQYDSYGYGPLAAGGFYTNLYLSEDSVGPWYGGKASLYIDETSANMTSGITSPNSGFRSYAATSEFTGTINSLAALSSRLDNDGGGTITNAFGFEVERFRNVGVGSTITNLYGIYLPGSFNNTGTVTNTYGVYVADITSTSGGTQTNTPYSFYASDPNAHNYFAGNVGIGTTIPSQKLEVNGGMRLNTATAQPTCDATTRGTFWVVQNSAGVKDTVEVCAKDAGDAYAWRTIY